jgi:hypothetical protein
VRRGAVGATAVAPFGGARQVSIGAEVCDTIRPGVHPVIVAQL